MPIQTHPPQRFVATLIGASERAAVSDACVEEARQAILTEGGRNPEIGVLDPRIAADIVFDAADAADPSERRAARYVTALQARLAAAAVDVIVQPTAFRRKRLLVADMDSTMIGQECIDELADFVGLREQVSAITERAMRGEIAFEPALRERVALLRGLGEDIVGRAMAERITLTPGGRALVGTMRANGAHAALVSGGFTAFTTQIAAAIGFDEHRANVLIVEDGRFAGLVAEPILGREAKLAALIELREKRGLRREETLAIGDGANDLAMLQEAGLGAAFRAKPAVAAAAHARIDHADLTALLFAQGYRRADFVE
jgi:phosphoserine phosphatase